MVATSGLRAAGFAVTWSVAIEEWFSLLFPWIIFDVPFAE
jgi:peptidoglycan/LPS O-acetylase OafA/YrhL